MLVIDIGNTFTRFAVFAGDVIKERKSISTREIQVEGVVKALDEMGALASGETMWVASVAPAASDVIEAAAAETGMHARFIRSGVDPIIPHRLKTPRTTGVDRLLTAMAAGDKYFPGEAGLNGYVIVQCGSAATIDIVDYSGCFCGGYILPGPTLWLTGISGAAQLPNLADELPDWNEIAIGDNTQDAILHGMAVALPMAVASAAMIIHANLEIKSDDGSNPSLPVAVTGGWGEAVERVMDYPHVFDRDLLLHGIRIFAEKSGEAD